MELDASFSRNEPSPYSQSVPRRVSLSSIDKTTNAVVIVIVIGFVSQNNKLAHKSCMPCEAFGVQTPRRI